VAVGAGVAHRAVAGVAHAPRGIACAILCMYDLPLMCVGVKEVGECRRCWFSFYNIPISQMTILAVPMT
jgi:hypothetical protein